MDGIGSLTDLHAAVKHAQAAVDSLTEQHVEADAQAQVWRTRTNELHTKVGFARELLRAALAEATFAEAYFARPLDGTDEAAAVATAEALLKGEVA